MTDYLNATALLLLLWLRLVGAFFVERTASSPTYQGAARRSTTIFAGLLDPSQTIQKYSDAPARTMNSNLASEPCERFSLAGPYLIDCCSPETGNGQSTCTSWSLVPLKDLTEVDDETFPSEGARAWAALHTRRRSVEAHDTGASSPSSSSTIQLRVDFQNENKHLHISASSLGETDSDLIAALSRILAQWTLIEREQQLQIQIDDNDDMLFTLQFSNEPKFGVTLSNSDLEKLWSGTTNWNSQDDNDNNNFIRALFADLDPSNSEIVEMVDAQGTRFGFVPRKLVHQHNLLHRGIGMFVTRDRPIFTRNSASTTGDDNQQQQRQKQPDLYCHRRTDDKRIFPSLYDIFVGGVSLANEAATVTARREVAEELGLVAALDGIDQNVPCPQLSSERLLQCVVCTAYNRCVVDLFAYTCHSNQETVTWQPEEVAWGSFVPYTTVEAAADRSILRLAERGAWPGRHPPVQSPRRGEDNIDCNDDDESIQDKAVQNWRSWDFVPDGLLVWEAWLHATESAST